MKAVVFHRPRTMSVDEVPEPKLKHPRDVILRVTSTAICGSDLHIYNGYLPQPKPLIMGHEFMGVVEEVGMGVSTLKQGDRVVVPFPIACGQCFFCTRSLPVHCERSNPDNYGPEGGLLTEKGGGLFGYTELYGGYDGGQAEYVRVPFADVGPRKVPDGVRDEEVLFLTDILPTGYAAIRWAGLTGGESVAVFGAGPVGLMAMKCAHLLGAGQVFALDREKYRLDMAREVASANPIDVTDKDWVDQLRSFTAGRGPDVAVDAVGMEAHHGFLSRVKNVVQAEMGSIDGLKMAVEAVRRGGVVTVVGVYGMPYDNFPIGQIFDKGLRLATGQAPVHAYIDELMDHVLNRRLRADDVLTHTLPLSEAARGYQMFNDKADRCVKVVLRP